MSTSQLLTFLVPFILVAAFFVLYVYVRYRKVGIGKSSQVALLELWDDMVHVQDPARRILEADAILDRALQIAGFQGSMGDKLKAAGPRLPNLDAVWSAHKLRNRIAHEPGTRVSEDDAQRALKAFEKAMRSLFR